MGHFVGIDLHLDNGYIVANKKYFLLATNG